MSSAALQALQVSIGTAQTATQSAIATADAQLTANPFPDAGTSPENAAAALLAQCDAMTELSQLYQLSSTLGRMAKNAMNAES